MRKSLPHADAFTNAIAVTTDSFCLYRAEGSRTFKCGRLTKGVQKLMLFLACTLHIELNTYMLLGGRDLYILRDGVDAFQESIYFGGHIVGVIADHFVSIE